jgi:hypothetical protein
LDENNTITDNENDMEIDLGMSVLCFSERNSVQVDGRGSVSMKDLQVGDLVLTGHNQYEPIYAFAHLDPERSTDFLQIRVDGGAKLEVSNEHMIFMKDMDVPVRADAIRVGDQLEGEASSKTVRRVKNVKRDGIYAPLTPSGTIVVNGVVASAYVSLKNATTYRENLREGIHIVVSQQRYVHMGLSPFRMLCMGVSSSICNAKNDDGMPYFVAFAVGLNRWADRQNIIIQHLALALTVVISGICMIFETVFGASWAPFVMLVMMCASLVAVWANKKSEALVPLMPSRKVALKEE